MKSSRGRIAAVVASACVLALAGASTAYSAGLIGSADIADGSIKSKDVKDGTLRLADLNKKAISALQVGGPAGPAGAKGDTGATGAKGDAGVAGPAGAKGDTGAAGAKGDQGVAGPAGPKGDTGDTGPAGPSGTASYAGANWSPIDRNIIGAGFSFLRAGPSAAGFLSGGQAQAAPYGVGSLGLLTTNGNDAVNFGNQVDFAGAALSSIVPPSYWIFTTGENIARSPYNVPNLKFEVDTNVANADDYSTLGFTTPSVTTPGWTKVDASGAGWWFTGSEATLTGCTQGTPCTWAAAKAAAKDATIHSVMLGKGRDYAFSGAVDGLQLKAGKVYDFEPFGVTEVNQ